jgi:hypothetical protein
MPMNTQLDKSTRTKCNGNFSSFKLSTQIEEHAKMILLITVRVLECSKITDRVLSSYPRDLRSQSSRIRIGITLQILEQKEDVK